MSLTPQLRFEEVEVWPEALAGCSDMQGAEGTDFAGFGSGWELEVVAAECTLAGGPRLLLPIDWWNCSRPREVDQAEEVIPYHGSSCSLQADEAEEEAARSCGPVAVVEAEVQGYKAALNPLSADWKEISALVCIPEGLDFAGLPERVYFGRDSVVRQLDQ